MKTIICFILCSACIQVSAQILTADQAIEAAKQNNKMLRAAAYETEYQRQVKRTSPDLPKTDINLLYGQYNSFEKKDNNITISQTIPFTVFGSQAALNRSLITSAELKKAVTEHELVYQVRQTYYHLSYLKSQQALLLRQDSIFQGFLRSASLRFKTGETNLLEKTTAEAQGYEVKNLLRENEADIKVYKQRLQRLINSDQLPDLTVSDIKEIPYSFDTLSVSSNPALSYSRHQVEVERYQKKLERAKFVPDITIGFFTQTLIGFHNVNGQEQYAGKDKRFNGFQIGVSMPIWFAPYIARIKAAEYNRQVVDLNHAYRQEGLLSDLKQAMQELTKNKQSLDYYRNSALPNATLILRHADLAFKNGEIGFMEYLVSVKNAISIQENYLRTLNNYNQSIITVEFISGNQPHSNGND